MKKNDKKFSFLQKYIKEIKNPLIQSYKMHLDLLHEAYIKELNKNKQLQEDIINICKHILKNYKIKNEDLEIEFITKYKTYIEKAYKEFKKQEK